MRIGRDERHEGALQIGGGVGTSGDELLGGKRHLVHGLLGKIAGVAVEVDAVSSAQHDDGFLCDLPDSPEAWRNIVERSLVEAGERCFDIAGGQGAVEVRGEGESVEGSLGGDGSLLGGLHIEVGEAAGDLSGRGEDFVTHTHVEREARGEFDVILGEGGEVGVALVSAEEAASGIAEGDIAQAEGAAVLGGALAEEEVVEGGDLEEAGDAEGNFFTDLVAFDFGAEAEIVAAVRPGDGVLPDEGIGDLPLRGSAGIADGEPADGETGGAGAGAGGAGGHAFTDGLRGEGILDCGVTVEAHVAEAGDVDEVRGEDVGIGEDEHGVSVEFVGAPAGNVGGVGREGLGGGRTGVEEAAGDGVLLAENLVEVDGELILAIMRGDGEGGLAEGELVRGVGAGNGQRDLRTGNGELAVGELRVEDGESDGVDVGSVTGDLGATGLS